MKKIGKLKLNKLEKAELKNREMNLLNGGGCCACACAGPSPSASNDASNDANDYGASGGGGNCACECCGDTPELTVIMGRNLAVQGLL